MVTVPEEFLQVWVATLMWPLTRILAFIAVAPLFNHRALPNNVKLGLGLVLTVAVMPSIPDIPPVSVFSMNGLLILCQQVIIGAAMGFSLRIIFSAVELAGHTAGMTMGLGFAMFYDPQTQGQSTSIGQFLVVLSMLLFLSIDGHLVVISTLAESFSSFPVTAEPNFGLDPYKIALWGGKIFSAGLLMSLPIIAALLLANLALGVLTRAAPQLNLFGIGFPITISLGFLLLMLALPYMMQPVQRLMHESMSFMQTLAYSVVDVPRGE
ncbi:flagellar biosynthetic protein FliR [Methylobacillus flagellatus]|uniref:Flagellar biosynthetic protein FliR n=1 Tax=Methylobacillus flagellatus (strain ATCC 51484 / DSM 6875 / VKM B-1610 / KT) TaxID=265072 RepID=Q1GZV4_METFK|nr:flagellar biosynthetic protein FliR [Methylobacillus flagellatus]ABE50233.1 flagellar biosynthetic protein FliR [Methylobacillus flagellatus KT]